MKAVLIFCLLFSLLALEATEAQGYLTPEEIALFHKQGYLLKPQCLLQTEIDQLNDNITRALECAFHHIEQSGELSPSDEDQILHIGGSRVVFKYSPNGSISIARINGCSGMQPALLESVRSEKMMHTFFELLGTSDLEHLISQIHPKLGFDGIAFPRHRDIEFRTLFDPNWQDILGNGSYAICIIPIDPMTQENGGLWIDRNNYKEPQGQEEDLLWIDAKPKDLLFMHPYLYHGSGPNLSTTSRRTLLTGFCAFGANHKKYPGADVNMRLTRKEDGTIVITPSPWSQTPHSEPISGH